ncbi:MAG: formylglycine-generating enzyme family protein [Armatimonadota bacterium]
MKRLPAWLTGSSMVGCALVLLSNASWAVYLVRVPDLSNTPLPPNTIKVYGTVTSESPVKISDGRKEISVDGLTARLGDQVVVTGDWDGSVLRVSGPVVGYIGPTHTEMICISAGSFLMGSNGADPYSFPDELPEHPVYLPGYWIGKHEVTRGEYRAFLAATGRAAPDYWDADQDWSYPTDDGNGFTQTDDHPVVGVSWYDAEAYCAWAGGRLPTEAEWEKAARWTGIYSNVYPWGNTWDAEKCNNYSDYNFAGGGYGRFETSPVGSYPSGSSPYGCQDMAGNVWEWCADWYKSYPGSTSPFDYTDTDRVLRGGSWNNSDSYYRTASRIGSSPGSAWYFYWYGFRLAR